MRDPVDPATVQPPPPPPDASADPPAVAWATAPPAGDQDATAGRPILDIVVWVVALAALVVLSLARASIAGTTGAERAGYVVGGVAFALLISAAARWLWLRARRRNDATVRFLSPWIPIGAVILAVLALFGGNRS
jgi:hypothetical protein